MKGPYSHRLWDTPLILASFSLKFQYPWANYCHTFKWGQEARRQQSSYCKTRGCLSCHHLPKIHQKLSSRNLSNYCGQMSPLNQTCQQHSVCCYPSLQSSLWFSFANNLLASDGALQTEDIKSEQPVAAADKPALHRTPTQSASWMLLYPSALAVHIFSVNILHPTYFYTLFYLLACQVSDSF